MRKLIAAAVLAALVAMPVAAAPVDQVGPGLSITTRVLEHVTGWLAKLRFGWANIATPRPEHDTSGAKSDDDSDRDDDFPPLDGIGMGLDPNG